MPIRCLLINIITTKIREVASLATIIIKIQEECLAIITNSKTKEVFLETITTIKIQVAAYLETIITITNLEVAYPEAYLAVVINKYTIAKIKTHKNVH